jgi:hypothetical protein
LFFEHGMASRLVDGQNPKNSTRHYAAPDADAELHNSMNWAWAILEWFPKSSKLKEWKKRISFLGMYLPRSEPRFIGADAVVDSSAYERMQYSANKPYKPVNLPQR